MIGPTAFFCFNGDLLMVIGGDADDQLGGQPFLPLQLSYSACEFKPIANGHLDVRNDQLKARKHFDHQFKRFFAVLGLHKADVGALVLNGSFRHL